METEKLKVWIDLAKWFIVSVVIAVITLIIDSNLKSRAANLQEVQEYGKYVNQIIVLNDDIKNRRLLAQYFSTVTVNDCQRNLWKEYFKILDVEYRKKYWLDLYRDSIARDSLVKLIHDKKFSFDSGKINSIINVLKASDEQLKPDPFVIPDPGNLIKKPVSEDQKWDIDIFYLEKGLPESKTKAMAMQQLLQDTYHIRVRMLSESTNSRSGYQIAGNEIRYEKNELNEANKIQSLLDENNLKFNLVNTSMNTPWYISIFVQ